MVFAHTCDYMFMISLLRISGMLDCRNLDVEKCGVTNHEGHGQNEFITAITSQVTNREQVSQYSAYTARFQRFIRARICV